MGERLLVMMLAATGSLLLGAALGAPPFGATGGEWLDRTLLLLFGAYLVGLAATTPLWTGWLAARLSRPGWARPAPEEAEAGPAVEDPPARD